MSAAGLETTQTRSAQGEAELGVGTPRGAVREVWDWLKLGVLGVELTGLACLLSRYELVSPAFQDLFLLVIGGFAVQYFLPLAYRLPLFLALSVVSISFILGPADGAWLVGVGVALVALAHLPAPFGVRASIVAAVGMALAALRTGRGAVPWSEAVWPILGAMFMFRLVVYLYDVKHGQAPSGWVARLCYFFMLPNVCFPLFPVVDPRTFERSYFSGERHDVHQRGVEWILRGAVQLIFYRLAYKKLSIDPLDIATAVDLAQYFIWLFLLYLRVSGHFHIIVGVLHLFGFNLPETHRMYYFASSFTDFWRRINIYWKDFMMKVFYYPMYFQTKRLGPKRALVISTTFVFVLTWALHAYQLFWIRGTYTFTWNDLLFWTILCGLVTVNALWESRHGRRRTLAPREHSWRDQAWLAAKTLATFTVICVLWSFWSSESLTAWASLWPAALTLPSGAQARAAAIAVAGVACAIAALVAWRRLVAPSIERRWAARAAFTLAQLFLLNLVSISAIYGRLGRGGDLAAAARFEALNQADLALLERGYYEDLLTVDRFNGELADVYANRPRDWVDSLDEAGLTQPAKGLQYQLRPNAQAAFCGVTLRTNQWGMHDGEYAIRKPPGCLRIAVFGASHAMGSGVERDATFEAVLERRLNQNNPQSSYRTIEVLNFAVYGYVPVEQRLVMERRAVPFNADVVMYVGHPGDADRVAQFVGRSVHSGAALADPSFDELLQRANVDRSTPQRLIQRRLKPFGEELLRRTYRQMTELCTLYNMRPIFVLLPMVYDMETASEPREPVLAAEAGFEVLRLDGVYQGPDWRTLTIAEWDAHPNERAHAMVGDRLYELLSSRPELLSSTLAPPDARGPDAIVATE